MDPTLDELAGQQQWSSGDAGSMTHWQPDSPSQVRGNPFEAARGFFDLARQPAPLSQGPPWQEKIDQAITRADPRYQPTQPQQQQNWQQWGEEALNYLPFAGVGALRMSRMAPGDEKWAISNYGGKDEWNLHSKETGKKMGELYTTYNPINKRLHIDYMTGEHPPLGKYDPRATIDQRSWGIGTHELQSLGPEVLREYPDIDTLHFSRIGGVFKDRPMTLTYKRVTMPDGSVGFERIKQTAGMMREPWRSPQERQQQAQARRQQVSAQQAPPTPLPEPPSPPSPEPQPQHGPGWTAEREETWDAMRQRQDAEWNALMQRLFGSR